jgi:hypothetical protein
MPISKFKHNFQFGLIPTPTEFGDTYNTDLLYTPNQFRQPQPVYNIQMSQTDNHLGNTEKN